MQKYTFKMHEPGSMHSEDVEMCPGLRKADMKQADDKFNFLFILGAQKAGTTWLHKELYHHPLFVEAQKAYKRCVCAAGAVWLTTSFGPESESLDLLSHPNRK